VNDEIQFVNGYLHISRMIENLHQEIGGKLFDTVPSYLFQTIACDFLLIAT